MSSSSSQLLVIKGASTPKTPLTSKVRRHQRCIDVKENAGNKESSAASQRKRSSGQRVHGYRSLAQKKKTNRPTFLSFLLKEKEKDE